MRTRLDQLLEWSRTHQGRKLIRFTSVSVVATLTSQLGILIIYGAFPSLGVIKSTLIANLIATVPSYHLNRKWTWGKHGRSHLVKEIIPFWTISGLGITCSFFFSFWARALVRDHHWAHPVNVLVAMAVNFLAFAIFWVMKLMLFNRIFHVSELEEVEEHLEHEEEFARDGGDVSP